MAAPGPRFCPRCGTERIGDMRFCPSCGLDLGQVAAEDGPFVAPAAPPAAEAPTVPPPAARRETARRRSLWRPLVGPGLLVLVIVVVAAWVTGLGPFSPRGGSGTAAGNGVGNPDPTSPFLPEVTSQPSFIASPGLTAPPVGLSDPEPGRRRGRRCSRGHRHRDGARRAPHHAGRQLRVRPARDRRRDRPLGDRARALGRRQRAQVPHRRRSLDDAVDARHLRSPGALTIRDRGARTTRSRRQERAPSRAPPRR